MGDAECGGPGEAAGGGFERGGWAMGLFDEEAMVFVNDVCRRADAFLFGRWTDELFVGYWGVRDGLENQIFSALKARPSVPSQRPGHSALDPVDSRAFPKGVTIHVYRPIGRPQ